MAPLVDGPTWVFPMLWANLHVGFYILIGTFLQHGLSEADAADAIALLECKVYSIFSFCSGVTGVLIIDDERKRG